MIGTKSLELDTGGIFKRVLTWVLYLIALVCLALLGWAFYTFSMPVDLHDVFLPAARHMLAGGNPYDLPGFWGPPWALVPALLVAWLPNRAAYAAHGVASILALLVFLSIQKVDPGRALPGLLSVPVLFGVLCGNLEPFMILALVLPRPVGLILLAMKPHIGCVLALYWLLDEWRKGKWHAVVRLLWPVSLLAGLSFVIYGFWPAVWLDMEFEGWSWNVWGASPWAHVFIVGIPAVFFSLWKEREDMALSAGPLLSPYTNVYGFAAWLPFMTTWPTWIAWLVCLAIWVLVCVQVF